MTDPVEPDLEMIFSFYEGIERKGPGSESSTLRALSLIEDLPMNPQILELGCGSGVASVPIIQSQPCHLTAVDIHQPFLDELQAKADQLGLAKRLTVVQADMSQLEFPNGSFDLIWSESAIYNVGFEKGLHLWKPLLKPGGYIAVTEVVWLTPDPPIEAKQFWEAEYPVITTIDENMATMRNVGYDVVHHFTLSADDWQNYYGPLQTHLDQFRANNSANPAAEQFANSTQREIDLWKEFGDSFGYCFFISQST